MQHLLCGQQATAARQDDEQPSEQGANLAVNDLGAAATVQHEAACLQVQVNSSAASTSLFPVSQ
jgi:hypothetical protein